MKSDDKMSILKISEKIPQFWLTWALFRIIIHHAPRCKGEYSHASYKFEINGGNQNVDLYGKQG